MKQSELEAAFILHSRPYRDTSLLLELFTEEHGRVACIARGARGKKHHWRHILMPFQPLAVSVSGKSELLTLIKAEGVGLAYPLKAKKLFCGFYLNEVLLYLLAKQDAYPKLFSVYEQTLRSLCLAESEQAVQQALRFFEKSLLTTTGYEIDFNFDFQGKQIISDLYYAYRFEQGFIPLDRAQPGQACHMGENLLCIAKDDYSSAETLNSAKQIFRAKIQYLLGYKTLKSREVFMECSEIL